ncbi:Hypothetical protein A7982_05728 [Minicystis rosea]|nr:Hypothetical protein A7982_05728 [Minicystis rosea]
MTDPPPRAQLQARGREGPRWSGLRSRPQFSIQGVIMILRVSSIALLVMLSACGGKGSTEDDACASVEGEYSGTYSVVSQGDCGPEDTFESTSATVDVIVTSGSVYLTAANESCQGELSSTCTETTLAGVCDGVIGIGGQEYPNLSRIVFGAGGSLLVTNINKMPSNTQNQCVLQVQFLGQKTR